jgi:hypothetical protein
MFTALLGVAAYVGLGWGGTPTAWHNEYAQAVAEACNSDKPLFIVICSGSSEYGQLATLGTFLSDGVEGKLRTDYVRFMIDIDTPAGRELAKRFDVEEGPHFVILDRTCKWQVYYRSGTLLESDLSPVLAQFRRAKLTASGRPIQEVARRQPVQICST